MSKSRVVEWRYRFACDQRLKSTTRLVLHTLALHMTSAGDNCYPTTKQLSYESGLSERAVCTHLKTAVGLGWLRIDRHGFAGQRWANHQYKPVVPDDYELIDFKDSIESEGTERGSVASGEKALNVVQCQGTERGSVASKKALNLTTEGTERRSKGTEPHDIKALNVVQCSSSSSSSIVCSVVDIYRAVSREFKKFGATVTVQAEHRFNEKAAKSDRVSEFALGAQNYLNGKHLSGESMVMALENFIARDSWVDPVIPPLPGPIHIPGAPAPPPADNPSKSRNESSADFAARIAAEREQRLKNKTTGRVYDHE